MERPADGSQSIARSAGSGSGPAYHSLLETSKETADKEEIGLQLTCDAYDAVVAASFGGIRIVVPSDEGSGKQQIIRLHPVIVFFFCLALFSVQLTCLSCLVMDMELKNAYEDDNGNAVQSWEGFSESPERQMKFAVKSIMVIVLQMMALKELTGAIRPILLAVNPYTWFELDRPNTEGKGCGFHASICAPICVAAQVLQFGVAYYVLTVSMSIIIIADDVKEVIFNGLVVTFLADLDEYAWTAMSSVFHMDQSFFENFRFKVKDDEKVISARNEARGKWQMWFYHGKGGKAAILENLLMFLFLAYLYIRQLFMYIQAVHTGILPVARDACSLYRGMKEPHGHWINAISLSLIDFFTFINYKEMLNQSVKGEAIRHECFTQEYRAGPFHDAANFIEWWPKQVISSICVILLIFAVPQVLLANYRKVIAFLNKAEQAHDSLQEQVEKVRETVIIPQ